MIKNKKNYKIKVMTRPECCIYCNNKQRIETVVISISTPNVEYYDTPKITDNNKVVDILSLAFNDADTGKDIMTSNDANKIVKFLTKHNNINHVIVHCDAGTSRSAGVAAAIQKWAINDDKRFFDRSAYRPNMLCYRLTLQALMESDMENGK